VGLRGWSATGLWRIEPALAFSMRKADIIAKHNAFIETVDWYRTFLTKIANASRVLGDVTEKREIAESIVLRLCAHWEYYIDELLVACVNRDHSKLSEHFGVTIPEHPSQELCQALIFGDGYRDFPSFGSLKGFSKKILPEVSNPFLKVQNRNGKLIDEVYAIRNYLSHYSHKAKRALMSQYKANHQMTRFLEPGQFLLAYQASRFDEYFDAFTGAASDMKGWLQGT
jgi:hypothetical protein